MTLEIVISEVVAHLEHRTQRLVESAPYRNHVAHTLAYAKTHDAEAFFRGKLGDVDEPTAPFGLLDVHGNGTKIEDAYEALEPALAGRIRVQARRFSVSTATLFHAAWGMVVAHTTGREDVVFGSVLLGRLHGDAGAQRTLGMFINTLPLRLRLQGVTARELVEQTQREVVELLSHEQASLAMAQRCSGIAGAAPLFSTLLNYRHSVPHSDTKWSSASGLALVAVQERTNYPITLSVDDLGDGFRLKAQTDRRIVPQRITGYLHAAVESLVKALEESPSTPVLALSVVPEAERQQVLQRLNATQAFYPREQQIHELFEAQSLRTPSSVAVMHEERSLTYAELNGQANQLARALQTAGVGPGQLVGICVERSLEMVVGLLGILKAGAAYVPLDPNYPPERLQYMLEDAAPAVVLTQEKLRSMLPATSAQIIVVEPHRLADFSTQNLPVPSGQEDAPLVYVIYTSGSTGRPKGTAMPHRAMVNLIEWHRHHLGLQPQQRVLQFAALSFDVAFQETFSTLCDGGTLVLLDEWVRRDARALLELLSRHSISRLFVPPLMLQSLAEQAQNTDVLALSLQDVITAGEQLRISPEISKLFQQLGGCRLHNHYGPTETHVVTALTLEGDPQGWPVLPSIGRPIANTQMYVLDARLQPTPMGVAGEIYIGGVGVARGYLKRAELSAQRFIKDPFNTEPTAQLYRTGDLGRWREDGTLEYLGRNDDQVKIRGYRIELGEIEARLSLHPQVKEAVVIAREDNPGEKRLVGYITCHPPGSPGIEELRAMLKAALPEHMVPGAFVILEALPLTPSGKVNRRVLPAPEIGAYATRQYEPPEGEIEAAMAQIWQQVLGVERVGRNDNFFELGGHSLHGMKLVAKVEDRFSVALPIVAIFKHQNIPQMAELVDAMMSARADRDEWAGSQFEEGLL